MARLISNFVGFQLSWLALVIGAAHGMLWPGAIACLAFLVWELIGSENRSGLAQLIAASLLTGIIVDGSYVAFDLVSYAEPAGPMAPYWILGLWLIFALTLPRSMHWICERPLVAGVLGAVFAPLSYLAGETLGAIRFPGDKMVTLLIIGASWIPAILLLTSLHNLLLGGERSARKKGHPAGDGVANSANS